ncbi:uncharacterized protein MELLADRAFT_91384 [Melampsora larici-populina 98AG31]|uniref:Serine hydroxymethyltransferase-like domain-containing protein n=1 Tax=Melampsora larici-populina (strain 98AG31 / pathotype 3-4-7) TaxID=747676 RepID=F4RYV3_MELLP|nr:uncharacterized protein MELLADRAFT_91384 [Melampsora larici-populina 98AG31]EGG02313.1 hypothetical protein MELLADRAFT_91384 [Melampsora larici-populina 98AG31]
MEANGWSLKSIFRRFPNGRYCAFRLDHKVWGRIVQPDSGSTLNLAVLITLIEPQDRIMGLNLPDGGHLTHGFYNAKQKRASSISFQSFTYDIDPQVNSWIIII